MMIPSFRYSEWIMATLHKTADVLFFLNAQRRACGVTEVAQSLGLPKTTAHRLLSDLRYRALVERDDDGNYRLGLGLVALGLGAARHDRVLVHAKPILERAAAELGQPVFFVASRGGELVVLDKVEGSGPLRLSPQIGGRIPVHCTAVGRVYLAHDPDALHDPWPAEVDREAYAALLADVRERGVAENREDWLEGLSAVASGVWMTGRLCGVVAAACMAARDANLLDCMARTVTTSARRLTQTLEEVMR